MKTFNEYNEHDLDNRINQLVIDTIKKKDLQKIPVNATDDDDMKKGKPTFKFPITVNVWLKEMSPPAPKKFDGIQL